MSNEDTRSVATDGLQRQETFWGWVDQAVGELVSGLIETTLKFEQHGQLQAGWNERTDRRQGQRNGYYRRTLTTCHGVVRVKIPRCRRGGIDCGAIFDAYQRRVADADRILRHAYLLGCSTRATAQLAEQVFGGTLSHQTVSGLMRWLDGAIGQWRQRTIAPVYKAVYVDGMHVDCLGQDRMVMLAAGLRDGGQLDVLDFEVTVGEQAAGLLKRLRQRGLEGVELFVSDEAGAIKAAVEEVYPEVSRQSCTFHRLKALRENVGSTDFRDYMVAEAARIFRCPSRLAAGELAAAWARQWKHLAPTAVMRFIDGLEDSLMFYSLPKKWWRKTRTNNPMERLIRTLRMRLDLMGCFHNVPAIERAVFGQLARWHKIKLTHNS